MKLETGRLTSKKKIYALLLAIFGGSVALIGTLKVVANVFFDTESSVNCSHGHELAYCTANKTSGLVAKQVKQLVSPSQSGGSL